MAVPAADVCRAAGSAGRPLIDWLSLNPTWPGGNQDVGEAYAFAAIDGGATDNHPMELARLALVGDDPAKRNPRDASTADKAVVLVDPFARPALVGKDASGRSNRAENTDELTVFSVIAPLLSTWLEQVRFRPQEAAIAGQTPAGCFSRFMISPACTPDAAEVGLHPAPVYPALASGSLGGFGGHLSRRMREHDFQLGRRNAQRFLSEHFVLDADNREVFAGWRIIWIRPSTRTTSSVCRRGQTAASTLPRCGRRSGNGWTRRCHTCCKACLDSARSEGGWPESPGVCGFASAGWVGSWKEFDRGFAAIAEVQASS